MKSTTKRLLGLLFLMGCTALHAQQPYRTSAPQTRATSNSNETKPLRINLYDSYAFKDSFNSNYTSGNYSGQLQDGSLYGGSFEYMIRPNTSVELTYLRMDTNAPTDNYYGFFKESIDFKVGLNYILLGANKSIRKPGSMLEGFGGLMAGMAIVELKNPKNNYSETPAKFAWGAKLGGIIWAKPNFGIKLQAQLLSVSQSMGGGLTVGTGGVGVGVSSFSSIYQFSLGGGLVFAIGQ